MCLTLCGFPTDRRAARRLFGVSRRTAWPGASHEDMRQALCKTITGFSSRWNQVKKSDASAAVALLNRAARRGLVSLVAGFCKHRMLGVTCGHAFVLTGAGDELRILDPLSRCPEAGSFHNAWARPVTPTSGQLLPISGAPWDLCLDQPLSYIGVGPHQPHICCTGNVDRENDLRTAKRTAFPGR